MLVGAALLAVGVLEVEVANNAKEPVVVKCPVKVVTTVVFPGLGTLSLQTDPKAIVVEAPRPAVAPTVVTVKPLVHPSGAVLRFLAPHTQFSVRLESVPSGSATEVHIRLAASSRLRPTAAGTRPSPKPTPPPSAQPRPAATRSASPTPNASPTPGDVEGLTADWDNVRQEVRIENVSAEQRKRVEVLWRDGALEHVALGGDLEPGRALTVPLRVAVPPPPTNMKVDTVAVRYVGSSWLTVWPTLEKEPRAAEEVGLVIHAAQATSTPSPNEQAAAAVETPAPVATPSPTPTPIIERAATVTSPEARPSPTIDMSALAIARETMKIGRRQNVPGQPVLELVDALRDKERVWFRFTLYGGADDSLRRVEWGKGKEEDDSPTVVFLSEAQGKDLRVLVQVDRTHATRVLNLEFDHAGVYHVSPTSGTLTSFIKSLF